MEDEDQEEEEEGEEEGEEELEEDYEEGEEDAEGMGSRQFVEDYSGSSDDESADDIEDGSVLARMTAARKAPAKGVFSTRTFCLQCDPCPAATALSHVGRRGGGGGRRGRHN